jgi:MFS family permease
VGPGSAALVSITGNLAHAGLYVALFSFSSAAAAAIFGRAMDRYGRRPLLLAAHIVAAVGYTLAGIGVVSNALVPFLVGGALLAFGFGGVLLTRVAAAEIFPAAERGRAVGWVQLSAVMGAIAGPVLLILSDPVGHFLARDPLSFVWFIAPPLHLFAAVFLLRATEPLAIARDLARYHPTERDVPPAVPALAPAHLVPVAIVALAANQAAMVGIMGVAGAAVHHAGHAVWVLGLLMLFHFVGMFGLSRFGGRAADRFGRRNTILFGIAVIAAGGLLVAAVPGPWSFGLIAATVILADVTTPARRARVVGRGDLAAQLASGLVALAGGWWFAQHGVAGLGLMAVAVVAIPAALLFSLVREPSPGSYGPSAGLSPAADSDQPV